MYRAVIVAVGIALGQMVAGGATAQAFPTGSPASQGFSTGALDQIGRDVETRIDRHEIPGAFSIVARNGVIVYENIAGYRDVERKKPLTEDTIFRWHSMTKPVICAGALILVDEGKLGLDDPVSKYIPAFANLRVYVSGEGSNMVTEPVARPVTVRDLMRHMSGFTYADFGNGPVDKLYLEHKMVVVQFPTLAAAAEEASKLPLLFQPGTHWQYGISIDILGRVIEKASGLPLGDFLEQKLFGPLGMKDAGFYVPDDKLGRFTAQYQAEPGALKLLSTPENSPWRNKSRPPSGGGGMLGTAHDYLRFAQMLLNDGELDGVRVLSPESVRAMRTNHLPAGVELSSWTGLAPYIGFGFGVAVEIDVDRRHAAGCNGIYFWAGSERTYFWIDPRLKIVGLWMSQGYKEPFDFSLADEMRQRVYNALVDQKDVAQCRK